MLNVAVAAVLALSPTPDPSGFMAGYWLHCEDGIQRTEIWMGPWRNSLEGLSLEGGPAGGLERMRHWYIQGEGVFLRVTRAGAPDEVRDYSMIEGGSGYGVYQARQPGYPQIIRYALEDGNLVVQYDAAEDRPAIRRVYQRAEFNSFCPGMGYLW